VRRKEGWLNISPMGSKGVSQVKDSGLYRLTEGTWVMRTNNNSARETR